MGMPCVTTQKRLRAREGMTLPIQIPPPRSSPHNQAKAEFSTPRGQVLSATRNFSKRQESKLEASLSASVFTSVMA